MTQLEEMRRALRPVKRLKREGIVRLPAAARGPWRIESFKVKGDDFAAFRCAVEGRPIRPGIYTRLVHEERGVIMSDTPAELQDFVIHGHGYEYSGRVLLCGLGLGMAIRYLLDKRPQVTHIDVIELDAAIIKMVGPRYRDPRVRIIHADALTYRFPKEDRWDFAWHDIWFSNSEEENAQRRLLNRRYGRSVGKQYTWGRGRRYAR